MEEQTFDISPDIFIHKLREALQPGLPEVEAHDLMDPLKPDRRIDLKGDKTPRESAVLVLWFRENGVWKFPLIQRPTYEGTHSGQIALPGGKQEPDETYFQTALRETEEEIGVACDHLEIIGELSDLYIPPSNFNVRPILSVSSEIPSFVPDEREVEEVLHVSIHQLLDDKNRVEESIPLSKNRNIKVPCFKFDKHIVWGATAMILSELIEILERIR